MTGGGVYTKLLNNSNLEILCSEKVTQLDAAIPSVDVMFLRQYERLQSSVISIYSYLHVVRMRAFACSEKVRISMS